MAGLMGGLALGAAGMGLSAMAANRAQAQQQRIAQQAAQQQQMQSMMAMQQQQQEQQRMNQLILDQEMESKKRAETAKASVGPTLGVEPKGLDAIITSPLGDTSTPNVGRKKLLTPPEASK